MSSTKQRILKAAEQVLIDSGPDFSLRKVAEKAGISLGNLQYHFNTKANLLQRLLNSYVDEYEGELERFIARKQFNGKESLAQLVGIVLTQGAKKEIEAIDTAFLVITAVGGLPEEIKEKYYERIYDLLYRFLQILAPEALKEELHRGTSLLYPYLESYSLFYRYLGISGEELAVILSNTVWSLLRGE